jgi:hypothetical protein
MTEISKIHNIDSWHQVHSTFLIKTEKSKKSVMSKHAESQAWAHMQSNRCKIKLEDQTYISAY